MFDAGPALNMSSLVLCYIVMGIAMAGGMSMIRFLSGCASVSFVMKPSIVVSVFHMISVVPLVPGLQPTFFACPGGTSQFPQPVFLPLSQPAGRFEGP